ncbi:MAG: bifunctional diguanylate cyclase/phosphodiesterase, partial [Sphingomonadales bacterium]|nr:bifunctional diguanylate cyclase/phosphodiesterase [Sphingomonadales bacterium]
DALDCENIVARWSGDEFQALLPGVKSVEEACRYAERMLSVMREPCEINGHSLIVSLSIGIAVSPVHGKNLENLIDAADAAMYHAKRSGGSQIHVYSDALRAEAELAVMRELEMRDALARNYFSLYFQPQLNCRDDADHAVEALIRWVDPRRGVILPGDFIPLAEQSDFICDIGQWVILEAVKTIRAWRDRGLNVRISVNVAPPQLQRVEFIPFIRACLSQEGVPPELLEIEITETFAMTMDALIAERLRGLHDFGVSIAIDDFGTGYSNLARLSRLPINRLKMDKSMIERVESSRPARTIAKSVIDLAHNLGFSCIAEGVETAEQHNALNLLGCDALQGFHFARPMPAEDAFAWLQDARGEPSPFLSPRAAKMNL